MKARMNELGLHAADLAGIAGSGAAGRVTVEDFEKFLSELDEHKHQPRLLDARGRGRRHAPLVDAPARHRRHARCASTPLLAHRKASNPKPGPALYALRALAIALGENSAPAGRLIGDKIVHPRAIDVGFAVEAEDGVLVPVLRNADKTPLAGTGRCATTNSSNSPASAACPRARRAAASPRSRISAPSASTWATPIPLPEQTLVLGLGAGRVVPELGRGEGAVRPRDRGAAHAELRSPRARRRRRGPVAAAHRGTAPVARATVGASVTRTLLSAIETSAARCGQECPHHARCLAPRLGLP